jgi:hypothetical protein
MWNAIRAETDRLSYSDEAFDEIRQLDQINTILNSMNGLITIDAFLVDGTEGLEENIRVPGDPEKMEMIYANLNRVRELLQGVKNINSTIVDPVYSELVNAYQNRQEKTPRYKRIYLN